MLLVSRRLPRERSRWSIPCEWRYSKPTTTCSM